MRYIVNYPGADIIQLRPSTRLEYKDLEEQHMLKIALQHTID
jgi:hypothetical protein